MEEYTGEAEELITLFKNTPPESILKNIITDRNASEFLKQGEISDDGEQWLYPEEDNYTDYVENSRNDFTIEERSARYYFMRQREKKDDSHFKGIWGCVIIFADNKICDFRGELRCKIDKLLEWNQVSHDLGQDLFTCAWKAWRDFRVLGISHENQKFDWEPILRTNDIRLEKLINKGLAENHYHLYGSTESFSLSWAVLMNFPERIRQFLHSIDLRKNLNWHMSLGLESNVLSWETRMNCAAAIRVKLFRLIQDPKVLHCITNELIEDLKLICKDPIYSKIYQDVGDQRMLTNCQVSVGSNEHFCLDYCMDPVLYAVDEDSCFRLLSGERAFLYYCFKNIFRGKWNLEIQTLFYLYLLLKSSFRQELIQVNNATGFSNFARYQDRKDRIFEWMEPYLRESLRLSIWANLKRGNVKSLEARITPRTNYAQEFERIQGLLPVNDWNNDGNYGFVIHFVKQDFEKISTINNDLILRPRNWKVRATVKEKALIISDYLQKSYKPFKWFRGIDAAASEIKCRPEVFATEFRFLRRLSEKLGHGEDLDLDPEVEITKTQDGVIIQEPKESFHWLGVTYHAGEDFMDIVDGLRAMDETIRFLRLKNGDRIGHGMAAGIEPEDYYHKKKMRIVLPKQDLLDDIVWLLKKTIKWKVSIPDDRRVFLETFARRLFTEIYGQAEGIRDFSLDDYYECWKLRGDNPDTYLEENIDDFNSKRDSFSLYDMSMKCGHDQWEYLRMNDRYYHFMFLYHYDNRAKLEGQQSAEFIVESWYISCVEGLQREFRRKMARFGIVLECNPTSNYLIGAFQDYTKHPIFKFNNHYICQDDVDNPQLKITINTDDLGVFATSLANEYALILAALQKKRHAEQNYDDEAIYEYLEMIRRNGFNASFICPKDKEFNRYEIKYL